MPQSSGQDQLLNSFLLSLSTIDQRLTRIESALHIPPLQGTAGLFLPGSLNNAVAIAAVQTTAAAAAAAAAAVAQQQQQQQQQRSASPPNLLLPPVKALEPPPEGFPVSARNKMQEELDSWTVPRGYSMRINGTRTHGGRQKIRLVCFRGGRTRPRARSPVSEEVIAAARAAGKRKPTTDRASKKCGCPFRFELVELGPGVDRYVVHFTNVDHMTHNHEPAGLRLDPRARKLPPDLMAEVDQWLREGVIIGKIQDDLKQRGYAHVLDFDLRNRKRALQKKDGLLSGNGAVMDPLSIPGIDVDIDGSDEMDGVINEMKVLQALKGVEGD